MDKQTVIKRIKDVGIVAVVRAENADKAMKITDACIAGGVPAIEMTFTVPKAHKVIEELSNHYTDDDIILGAGTVLDAETARIAILKAHRCIRSVMVFPIRVSRTPTRRLTARLFRSRSKTSARWMRTKLYRFISRRKARMRRCMRVCARLSACM